MRLIASLCSCAGTETVAYVWALWGKPVSLQRAGLCLIAATRAIGHPIGVHSPEFWPVWKSFVERNERIDEALRGRNGKKAPPPSRELRELDLSGAIEMTPEIKAKLGLAKGLRPDYSATLRSCPALDNGTTVTRIVSEWGRDESFVEFVDGFGAKPAAPAKVEAPPAATPASGPVDEARREENDDLAHHETLAHAIKDRLDGLETQYGDRRGDESHGRVLQFALEFLGDCYSACNFYPHMRGIGVENSYDLFQAQSACAIHPVSCEARMNMFGEAEVRTPA